MAQGSSASSPLTLVNDDFLSSPSSLVDDALFSSLESIELGKGTATAPDHQTDMSSTFYMPIVSPPTPAPSPRPISAFLSSSMADSLHSDLAAFKTATPTVRQRFLSAILASCSPAELLFVSTTIAPLLKRDFLRDLPVELSLHIVSFIDDARTLARSSCVSRFWNQFMRDEGTWKRMCVLAKFDDRVYPTGDTRRVRRTTMQRVSDVPLLKPLPIGISEAYLQEVPPPFSYRKHFIYSYKTMTNWKRQGRLLNRHRPPYATPDGGVVTSVALDHEWIVVGLASCRIQVFLARTGVLFRTLVGHDSGVWAVNLVSAGSYRVDPPRSSEMPHSPSEDKSDTGLSTDIGPAIWRRELTEKFNAAEDVNIDENDHGLPDSLRIAVGLDQPPSQNRPSPFPPKPSDICCASEGWGNPNALVVSGGCDKQLRVWDVKSGICIYILQGHTSTIRCLRVLHNRPIAITGSRDTTLRVWDVQRGKLLRTLMGHEESVRCLDVCGNQAVSGSYDATCRLWNVDTGECLHVLRGHLHQIYSVAFDGSHIASGGLDTTVRVWNPVDGQCLALLQGHTALVCQLQLTGSTLATGGSDGRVITFSLAPSVHHPHAHMSAARRIAAHDSSVTALQLDTHWLVTGGNDGRVRLYDAALGTYVRDLTNPAEAVWKVAHKYDKCVIMCKRGGKTVMEIWSFRPSEEDD